MFTLSQIAPGVWRGSQPITDADWDQLCSLGIEQIIKLNSDSEFGVESSDDGAVKRGILVRCFPIDFIEQFVTEPNLFAIRAAVDMITPGTFIHCWHGQDRTGLVVALWRLSQGWTLEMARNEMLSDGFHRSLFGLDKAWADLSQEYLNPRS